MALTGLTVTCGYSGTPTYNQSTPPLLSRVAWQEGAATGTLSTNAAPGANKQYGPSIFEVYAVADSWFSYGATPDSTASPRVFIPATTLMDFIVEPGDKFMWQAA